MESEELGPCWWQAGLECGGENSQGMALPPFLPEQEHLRKQQSPAHSV